LIVREGEIKSNIQQLQYNRSLLELIDKETKLYSSATRGHSIFLSTWAMIGTLQNNTVIYLTHFLAQKISGIVNESTEDVFGKASISTTVDFVNYTLALPLKGVYAIPVAPNIKVASTLAVHSHIHINSTTFRQHGPTYLLRIIGLYR
jgi:hypothetical protein